MHRLFVKLVLLLAPIIAVVAVTNIYVDSGNILGGIDRKVAKIVASGRNAGVSSIPSGWGALQVSVVEERAKLKQGRPLDVVVFGTSRSSEISGDLFGGKTFFNCAVPGGNVLDYLALYGLYKKAGTLPKYLIVSIDPWSFTGRKEVVVTGRSYPIADTGTPLAVAKGLEPCFQYGVEDLGITLGNACRADRRESWSRLRDYLELLSPLYFKASLRSMLSSVPTEVFVTDKKVGSSFFVIRSDGSYSLAEESAIDGVKVAAASQRYAEVMKGRLFVHRALYTNCLYALLDGLKKEGVVPVVYFSPLHPVVYDTIVQSEKNGLEDEIKKECGRRGVVAVGSFNPHCYGVDGTGSCFIDEYHPVTSLVRKIFETHRASLQGIGLLPSPPAAAPL